MAQGGATAIEDAAILARCLEEVDGEDFMELSSAMKRIASPALRAFQAISSAILDEGGTRNTSWLYGYDAWNVPLTPWTICQAV